ncbi:hypothetical protein F4808DRAFT_132164 [Astrocystis sublimbata]|nr:hypothetical protein F4808DRAFT_132164 [Astrocystis sublimbata]
MPAQSIMKLITLLALPMSAFAVPDSALAKRYYPVPFSDDSLNRPQDICSTPTYHDFDSSNTANMADCLKIGEWSQKYNGMWLLDHTTSGDENDEDWHILIVEGNCALCAKNTAPAYVGNVDVVDLIEDLRKTQGTDTGPVEVRGIFDQCKGWTNVTFWIRHAV